MNNEHDIIHRAAKALFEIDEGLIEEMRSFGPGEHEELRLALGRNSRGATYRVPGQCPMEASYGTGGPTTYCNRDLFKDREWCAEHLFEFGRISEEEYESAPATSKWEQVGGSWPTTPEGLRAFADWQGEVANHDTLLGFHAWRASKESAR